MSSHLMWKFLEFSSVFVDLCDNFALILSRTCTILYTTTSCRIKTKKRQKIAENAKVQKLLIFTPLNSNFFLLLKIKTLKWNL